MPRGDSPRRRLAGSRQYAAGGCALPDFSLRALRESYDSAYTLLFSGLAVVTLLCALMIWLTLCRKGRYPNPRQWILNPLIALHLGVSIATIGTHLSALYQKTHTRRQAELLLILRVIDGEWFRSVRNDGRAGKRSAPLSAARRRIRQSSSPPRRGDRRRERACGSASPSRSYCRRRRRQI